MRVAALDGRELFGGAFGDRPQLAPRDRARRNPAIAWPWFSDLPTSINSTSGPRWTTDRERPASRTRSRQRSCHIPYPDMPATSREPLVDQNGVSPSPN